MSGTREEQRTRMAEALRVELGDDAQGTYEMARAALIIDYHSLPGRKFRKRAALRERIEELDLLAADIGLKRTWEDEGDPCADGHDEKVQGMRRNGQWHDTPEWPLGWVESRPSVRAVCRRCGAIRPADYGDTRPQDAPRSPDGG